MWAILKYDKKYLGLLQSELIQKLGSNTKFYLPKLHQFKNDENC